LVIIIAAVITPPDVASQILVSLPLIGLYEVSIWIAGRVNPLPKDEEEDKDEYDYDESKNKD
jgi:sec-independent protein translocase protein TatC